MLLHALHQVMGLDHNFSLFCTTGARIAAVISPFQRDPTEADHPEANTLESLPSEATKRGQYIALHQPESV
jgi:hypothetical protein